MLNASAYYTIRVSLYLATAFITILFFAGSIFYLFAPPAAFAAVSAHPFAQTFAWGNVTVGDEVYGLPGPQSVNCLSATYQNAQSELDNQRNSWISSATTAIPDSAALSFIMPGPTGTPINAPLVLQQPDGFSVTLTAVDLAISQGYQSGSTSLGVPSFADVKISGSANGCTMQDNAPKASSVAGDDYYFNQLNNLRGLNAIRINFGTPVQAFGAYLGDLETSLRGTTAFLRLFDANGIFLDDVAIPSTIGASGGVAAENAQCDFSSVPDADVASQGLVPGCGNGSTRWVGFVSTTPIGQILLVVGDNDPLPTGLGQTEKLSINGLTVVRSLPPAEVTVTKSAPLSVTVGEPFDYTIIISNTSDNLAADIALTDSAPAGVVFVATAGNGCSLLGNIVSCQMETLAAHSAITLQIRALAQVTTTVTNLAQISAFNDSDLNNNDASATLTPLAAAPRNDCAPPVSLNGPVLVINEVMYNEAGSNGDEWVELFATRALTAGTQFYLSDDEIGTGGFNRLITIPAGGIPAGTYIVIHDDPGSDDLDASDGMIELWGAGSSGLTSANLRNSSENITLYAGSVATTTNAIDYVRYGSDATDATNDPPPASVLWSGFGPGGAVDSQSIALIYNGVDGINGSNWTLAGTNGTISPSTPGARNNNLFACNVAITKAGPLTSTIGAPFDYSLIVKNSSPVTVSNVFVTDSQPSGVTFNNVSGTGCNLTSGVVKCAVGSLAPGASQVITINATATTSNRITNTAQTNALSDTFTSDNQATLTTYFAANGSIGDFIYLDSNNNGTQESNETTPINGVPITLTLPNGTILTTVSEDGLYHFANLVAGTYTVTVGNVPGYIRTSSQTHVVTLSSGEEYVQADFGFNYALATLELTKQSVLSTTVGERIPYTLTVHNLSSTVTALDVVISDTQPSGIFFVNVLDSRCALENGVVICNLGHLAPLASETIVIVASAQSSGEWTNQARAVASNAPESSDSVVTIVSKPSSLLQLTKRVLQPTSGFVRAGDVVLYALRIDNHGTTTANEFTLVDRYDNAQLRFAASSIPPDAQSTGILTWTLGTSPTLLPAGEAITITVAFTVAD